MEEYIMSSPLYSGDSIPIKKQQVFVFVFCFTHPTWAHRGANAMFGGFPRGCLSLCFLQASSAAAEQRVSDEGTPVLFRGERLWRHFLWVFAVDKESASPVGANTHYQQLVRIGKRWKSGDYSRRPALRPSGHASHVQIHSRWICLTSPI